MTARSVWVLLAGIPLLGALGCSSSGGGDGVPDQACLRIVHLVYADGSFLRFAATAEDPSARVDRSDDDGATWQAAPDASIGFLRPVYGNGVFFAAPDELSPTDSSFRSTDGAHWDATPHAPTGAVAFGRGVFVWARTDGIFTSPDAVDWTLRDATRPSGEPWVSFDDGLFVVSARVLAVGKVVNPKTAENVLTSPDGITWTSSSESFQLADVMETLPFRGGVVVAHDDSAGDETAFDTGFAPDLAGGWVQGPRIFTTGFTPFAGQVYAAQWDLGGDGHVVATADGSAWSERTTSRDYHAALAASDTTLVAATSCQIQTTTDGVHWTERTAR
jgi:hypothetical protein